MSRLRCCLYILMAKRYAVFTADEGKTIGKRTHCEIHCEIHNSNTVFLSAIVSYVKKLASQCKEAGEQILKEVEK